MARYNILVICAVFCTVSEAKYYRDDYVYNSRSDAFYKMHVSSNLLLKPWQLNATCVVEEGELLSPVDNRDIYQVHVMMKQYPNIGDYVYVASDGKYHEESDEETPIINLEDTNEEPEVTREVITRDGAVESRVIYQNLPFVCKVEAKKVPYDQQCGVHASGYYYYKSVGSCYRIPPIAYTWNEAEAECRAEGAHLAIINSDTERLVLQNMTALHGNVRDSWHYAYFHIGFRAEKVNGNSPRVFKTIFNQTLEEAGFVQWSPTEPNNQNGIENCGSILKDDGKLNDIACSGRQYAFICEKEVGNKS